MIRNRQSAAHISGEVRDIPVSGHRGNGLATFAQLLCGAGMLSTFLAVPPAAQSQSYPSRAVTVIVPYSPGGPADLIVRAITDSISSARGWVFVLENRPGASQVIGTRAAARADPDGYTLLLGSSTSLALNPVLKSSLPYDALNDFEPISLLYHSPQYLITRNAFPAASLGDLIGIAKSSPGKLTYASIGAGTTSHIAGEYLNAVAGIAITHVPYTGAAPAIRDVTGGHVDMTYTTAIMSQVRAGVFKAIAVTSASRTAVAPDIPTFEEAGLPSFDTAIWFGLLAPKGTPAEIVARLTHEMKQVKASGLLAKRLGSVGEEADIPVTSPTEFRAFIVKEIEKWRGIVGKANVRAE